jgi:hypothetical protein
VIECQNLLSVTRLKIDDSLSHMDFLLTVNKDLFLTRRKDTPNYTKDRDMAVTSSARFLILDPPFQVLMTCPQLLGHRSSSFTPTR